MGGFHVDTTQELMLLSHICKHLISSELALTIILRECYSSPLELKRKDIVRIIRSAACMTQERDRGKKEPQIENGSERCFAGPVKMNRNNFSTDSMYWVGQNVHLGFSHERFGQPNTLLRKKRTTKLTIYYILVSNCKKKILMFWIICQQSSSL